MIWKNIWTGFVSLFLLQQTIGWNDNWHKQVFYEELNTFRMSPIAYQQNHPEVVIHCSFPLDETYRPLNILDELQNSSSFQARTVSQKECVVTHETCDLYCIQFGTCSYIDRINYFLQNIQHHNVLEILISGPKDPHQIFYYFLGSEPHCNHMLNAHINSVGASFSHIDRNVFVADFCYVNEPILI